MENYTSNGDQKIKKQHGKSIYDINYLVIYKFLL